MSDLTVYKDKVNIVMVDSNVDVSEMDLVAELLATNGVDVLGEWDVANLSDGTDGKLLLTLDGADISATRQKVGYLNLKNQVSPGVFEPVFLVSTPILIRAKCPNVKTVVTHSDLSSILAVLTGLEGLDLNFVTENELSTTLSDYATTESLGTIAATVSEPMLTLRSTISGTELP